jgi:NCAIR mutase (PurE)-related protein
VGRRQAKAEVVKIFGKNYPDRAEAMDFLRTVTVEFLPDKWSTRLDDEVEEETVTYDKKNDRTIIVHSKSSNRDETAIVCGKN